MKQGDYATWLAMRAALGVVHALPRGLALGAGSLLGAGARLLGMRRQVTADNLAKAFPEKTPGERAAIARGVYRHFGRMAVDSMRFADGPQGLVPLTRDVEGVQRGLDLLKQGKGLIILTGHVGNWELAGGLIAALGVPLSAVVKPPANRYVADHTESVRRSLGIQTIPMPQARTGVLDALRQNRAVALVADQGALRSSTWTPFFGRPTQSPSGPGLFAARSGAPVLFGALVAEGHGYRLEVEVLKEAISSDARVAIEEVSLWFRRRLESIVRRHPEQYLWTHRLWKRQPAASAAHPPGAP